MRITILTLFFLACLFLFTTHGYGQEPLKPRPSPFAMVSMKYEDTYVKITYGRPHKRSREIFGELVPFGKVWRTGANEATEITITEKIKIADNEMEAGTYTLFTIPNPDTWTIILNSDLGQWGSYKYLEEYDVLRFEVPAETISDVYEPFTIEFEQEEDITNLIMIWDQTKVSIPLEFYP